jgi:hypothetical protein
MLLGSAGAILRGGGLPRWLGWAALVLAVIIVRAGRPAPAEPAGQAAWRGRRETAAARPPGGRLALSVGL